MADKIVDALAKSPTAISRYEQLQAEARKHVEAGFCPPEFSSKVREFAGWLRDNIGQRVTGKELALARLRVAAASQRAVFSEEDSAVETTSGITP